MAIGQRKDGRWYVAWRNPTKDGKVVYEYFGFGPAGKAEAMERDHEIKIEKVRSRNRTGIDFGKTFRDLAQDYINVRCLELSAKTRQEILRTTAFYALSVIGGTPIGRITMAHWSEIEKRMIARKVTARTINKYFQYLSKIFSWGVERDYLRENPWARRKPLRIKERFQVELLTPEEFQRIVAAADDHLKWALEVEINTGVRPGPTELFALKWDDFDYETGAVRIYSPKTDSYHIQYVSPEFLTRMQARREYLRLENERLAKRRGQILPECPYVVSFQGAPIRSQLSRAWAAAKKKAGITRRVRLYDIRHFFITYALAGGAELLDLAHRVGHKNANMIVNVYAHLVSDMQTKQPFKLPEIEFTAIGVPKLLVQIVSTNGSKGKHHTGNNLITLDKNGRGGRI